MSNNQSITYRPVSPDNTTTDAMNHTTMGSITRDGTVTDILANDTGSESKVISLFEVEPTVAAVVVPVLFALIFVVGVVGNGTLIFTVVRNKVMRNVPNILIVSLSVGDLLLILVSVPFSATIYTFTSWPYGEAVCKFSVYMQCMSLGISIFTLTALSVDRYMAIVDPMSKHTGKTLAKALIVVGVIWTVSIIFAIPDGVFANVFLYERSNTTWSYTCSQFPVDLLPLYPMVYWMVSFFVYFSIPVLTIAFFYIMMARILIRSGQSLPCEGKSVLTQQRQIAARKKVAKVVLSFVVIFFVCWLPRYIYILWFWYNDAFYNDFWHVFKIIGFCLTFMNSCVNPFALYFLSSQFRKYYNRYLFCCIPKARYTSLEPSSTMHNFNSTVRRASSTTTTIVQSMSQSMC